MQTKHAEFLNWLKQRRLPKGTIIHAQQRFRQGKTLRTTIMWESHAAKDHKTLMDVMKTTPPEEACMVILLPNGKHYTALTVIYGNGAWHAVSPQFVIKYKQRFPYRALIEAYGTKLASFSQVYPDSPLRFL